jgi:hypothetical protein
MNKIKEYYEENINKYIYTWNGNYTNQYVQFLENYINNITDKKEDIKD